MKLLPQLVPTYNGTYFFLRGGENKLATSNFDISGQTKSFLLVFPDKLAALGFKVLYTWETHVTEMDFDLLRELAKKHDLDGIAFVNEIDGIPDFHYVK